MGTLNMMVQLLEQQTIMFPRCFNIGTAMGDANKSSTPVYCLAHTLFF